MKVHAYLFEAKSIQSYLLATSRLKEIVGGSELVESLTGSLLDNLLAEIDKNQRITLSRRGGGSFYAFCEDGDMLSRLATIWPLLVRQHVPELPFVHARGHAETTIQAFMNAHAQLLSNRNLLTARLPQAGPLADRSRRTGDPAVVIKQLKGRDERIDRSTQSKLRYASGHELVQRLSPGSKVGNWPLNLTPEDGDGEPGDRDFPFGDGTHLIALVHADGNGLGQLLMDLIRLVHADAEAQQLYREILHAFSEAVTESTQVAAQHATEKVLEPARRDQIYPARPIVLGGDDLTVIVRADLALDFTRTFLSAFEAESRLRIAGLKMRFGISDMPDGLTACAGIAYANASQPIHMLHTLAEDLCRYAKNRSRSVRQQSIPSSIAFHRVTTSSIESYDRIVDRELTAGDLCQTLGCYAVGDETSLPALDKLLELQAWFNNPMQSRGAARELLGLVGRDRGQALRHYKRWREIMMQKKSRELNSFDGLLMSLVGTRPDAELPYGRIGDEQMLRTPLGDVVILRAVNNNVYTDLLSDRKEGAA